MFDHFNKLPVTNFRNPQPDGNSGEFDLKKYRALKDAQSVDCQTIQLLAEMRFLIADQQSQCFFVNLVQTSDFWVNTHDFEVMLEFWSFVKDIYAQNPVLYNTLFPISNLIDLMLKISEAQSGVHGLCCQYHQSTQVMYSAQEMNGENNSTLDHMPTTMLNQQTFTNVNYDEKKSYGRTDEYLEPIAGVLENVLTSQQPEILDQMETLAKCLTARSSSCFYLQILKLLKVLLLDTAEREGNSNTPRTSTISSAQFAQKFL